MGKLPAVTTLWVRNCARCGEDHRVSFHRIETPLHDWTHVGICASTNNPLLLKFPKKRA